MEDPEIKQVGERAFLLEFEQEISERVLQKVLFYKDLLQNFLLKGDVEITNTYNSLLVSYAIAIDNAYDRHLELKKLISIACQKHNYSSRVYHLPVCYDEHFAIDLAKISTAKGVTKEEIISLHTAAEYTLYFIGFLPGFLYLGGLPKELFFSRRNEPRLEVQKGAVGIGEKQTGIYPQKSPGGWNIIGNSPVPLFDPYSNPPSPFSAGDKIRFYPITRGEHSEISEKVALGEFSFKIEEDESRS